MAKQMGQGNVSYWTFILTYFESFFPLAFRLATKKALYTVTKKKC